MFGQFGASFGEGMLDEQNSISNRRMEFQAKMAELIARNPDLDADAIMRLVDSSAGTDNTLRGVITRDSAQSFADTQSRARRVQLYNALQQWKRENPGATDADAQEAFFVYSGGKSDKRSLDQFLEQNRRQRAEYEKKQKLSDLANNMQTISALEQRFRSILADTKDVDLATKAFKEQYPDTDGLFDVERYAQSQGMPYVTSLIKDDFQKAFSAAEQSGLDLKTALVPPPTYSGTALKVWSELADQAVNAKNAKLNATINNLGVMSPKAETYAKSGLSRDAAFSAYIYDTTGLSPQAAEASGIDLKSAKAAFDSVFTQSTTTIRQTVADQVGQRWSQAKLPVALKYLDEGRVNELRSLILQDLQQLNPNFGSTQEADQIIETIKESVAAQRESALATKSKQIDISVSEQVKKQEQESINQARAAFAQKETADALGGIDEGMLQTLASYGSMWDFTDPKTQMEARRVVADWAAYDKTDLRALDALMRGQAVNKITPMSGIKMEDYKSSVDRSLRMRERDFGDAKLITPQDYAKKISTRLQDDVGMLRKVLNDAASVSPSDIDGIKTQIAALEDAGRKIASNAAAIVVENEQRSAAGDWAVPGTMEDPQFFKRIEKAYGEQLAQPLTELQRRLSELRKRVSTLAQNPAVGIPAAKMDPSRVEAQPGAVSPTASTAASPAGRFMENAGSIVSGALSDFGSKVSDMVRNSNADSEIVDRQVLAIADHWGQMAAPIGWFFSQSEEERNLAQQITSMLKGSRADIARAFLASRPDILKMLSPDAPIEDRRQAAQYIDQFLRIQEKADQQ